MMHWQLLFVCLEDVPDVIFPLQSASSLHEILSFMERMLCFLMASLVAAPKPIRQLFKLVHLTGDKFLVHHSPEINSIVKFLSCRPTPANDKESN